MKTLYNYEGRAVAYIDDEGKSIYLYSGTPVGWISGDAIYSYSGTYLGWLQNGWVWDCYGRPAFFTDESTGGPRRPVRRVRPTRGTRKVRPVRGVHEVRPVRPIRSMQWSSRSNESYFDS